MLTGESIPVRRGIDEDVFTGTFAVQGDATGVVVATGTRTRLAGIAAHRGGRAPTEPAGCA